MRFAQIASSTNLRGVDGGANADEGLRSGMDAFESAPTETGN